MDNINGVQMWSTHKVTTTGEIVLLTVVDGFPTDLDNNYYLDVNHSWGDNNDKYINKHNLFKERVDAIKHAMSLVDKNKKKQFADYQKSESFYTNLIQELINTESV